MTLPGQLHHSKMVGSEHQTLPLFLLGSSHHTAPLEVRERFALQTEYLPELYQALRQSGLVRECLVLNTCNRVEIYGLATAPMSQSALLNCLADHHQFPSTELESHGFWLEGEAVVKHLFEVVSGIDSQMLGETEILGQVKQAYFTAESHQGTGPVLNRLFQRSFQAAKWARSQTRIGVGQISIGNVAVDLAARVCGDITDVNLLLLGTGEAGQKTAQALRSRGAHQITVASRNPLRARQVADTIDAAATTLDHLDRFLPYADVVIGSTTAFQPIITRERLNPVLRRRAARPFFLIDLAVPRNFESSLGHLNNVYLYNLDDLAAIANENAQARANEVQMARKGLHHRANFIWDHLNTRGQRV